MRGGCAADARRMRGEDRNRADRLRAIDPVPAFLAGSVSR
jgi:hypothetical protein